MTNDKPEGGHWRDQPCRINGIDFPNQKKAAEYFNTHPATISTVLSRGNADNFRRFQGRKRSHAKPLTMAGVDFPSQRAIVALGISLAAVSRGVKAPEGHHHRMRLEGLIMIHTGRVAEGQSLMARAHAMGQRMQTVQIGPCKFNSKVEAAKELNVSMSVLKRALKKDPNPSSFQYVLAKAFHYSNEKERAEYEARMRKLKRGTVDEGESTAWTRNKHYRK